MSSFNSSRTSSSVAIPQTRWTKRSKELPRRSLGHPLPMHSQHSQQSAFHAPQERLAPGIPLHHPFHLTSMTASQNTYFLAQSRSSQCSFMITLLINGTSTYSSRTISHHVLPTVTPTFLYSCHLLTQTP